MNQLIYSDTIVNNSIVNSTATDTFDDTKPFSFFEFLKYTNTIYTPSEYNTFYTQYLHNWYSIKNNNNSTAEFIRQQYIDLLKDISLNYTTTAEKEFLTNINFDNPHDIEIVLPFYSKKIKEIILFYKQKRDEGTFIVERNKIKGTSYSLERAIYQNIISYLFSDDGINNYSLINYNIEKIKQDLEINIIEYVDIYSNYFDISPTPIDEQDLRKELYSFNTNSIETDIFFYPQSTADKQIFDNTALLTELPFIVKTTIDYNNVCSQINPLNDLIEQDNQDLLGSVNRTAIRKKLFEKYLGTDFYYLSTNTNYATTSGIFIKAENPSGNLLNLQTADIAAIESNNIKKLRDIGLFFKPDKQGILKINTKSFQYQIDYSKIEPNKLYIFPDPSVYGNVSLNRQIDYPFIFSYDISHDIRNISSGIAYGDPKVEYNEQSLIPYYSRQQNREPQNIFIDISDVYNMGIVTKWQTDIYGNQYVLFKDSFGQYFFNSIEISQQHVKCLTLDGHLFFDTYEGYNFDYSKYEVDGTTIRSGLTSLTITNSNSGTSFNLTDPLYLLNFRKFYPYQECTFANISTTNIKYAELYNCGTFTKFDGSALSDPIHADLSAYPQGYYYYDYFMGASIGSIDPLHRALIDVPTLSADFSFTLTNFLSTFDVERVSCGYFTDDIKIKDQSNLYIDTVLSNSQTELSQLSGNNNYKTTSYYRKLSGNAFVKRLNSTLSYTLSDTLSAIINKYNTQVQHNLNHNLKDFEIIYDTIILDSGDIFIIDKLTPNLDKPNTTNTFFITNTSDNFNIISTKFFTEFDNHITFAIMNEYPELSGTSSNIIYPTFYQYNITNNKTIKLWPKTSADILSLSSHFSTYGTTQLSSCIVSILKPHLIYNTLNSTWKLTFIGKDLNDFPYIFDYSFKQDLSNLHVIDTKMYILDSKYSFTTYWASPSISYINTNIDVYETEDLYYGITNI